MLTRDFLFPRYRFFKEYKKLEFYEWSSSPMSEVDKDEKIPSLIQFLREHQITELGISSDSITPLGVKTLASLDILTSLYVIGVHMNTEEINTLALNTALTELNLSSCSLDNKGLEILATSNSLTSLDVSATYVGSYNASGNGIRCIAKNANLIKLNLRQCGITNKDLEILATTNSLVEVDLSENYVGSHYGSDNGIQCLARNTSIKVLDLRWCDITDNDLKILADNTTLQKIYLDGRGISSSSLNFFISKTCATILFLEAFQLEDTSAKLWAYHKGPNTEFTLEKDCISETGHQALQEANTRVRANFGRELGIKSEVPSLLKFCLFAIKKQNWQPQSDLLPLELIEELQQPTV